MAPRAKAAPTGWQAADADIIAIVEARHPDPFAILGPHEAPGGLVIRCFVPGAESDRGAGRGRRRHWGRSPRAIPTGSSRG